MSNHVDWSLSLVCSFYSCITLASRSPPSICFPAVVFPLLIPFVVLLYTQFIYFPAGMYYYPFFLLTMSDLASLISGAMDCFTLCSASCSNYPIAALHAGLRSFTLANQLLYAGQGTACAEY